MLTLEEMRRLLTWIDDAEAHMLTVAPCLDEVRP